MDIREQIGSKIRQARETQGLTQEELAVRLKKTKAAVSSYETGNRVIRVTELPELAKALGVPITFFFEEEFFFSELTPANYEIIRQLTTVLATSQQASMLAKKLNIEIEFEITIPNWEKVSGSKLHITKFTLPDERFLDSEVDEEEQTAPE
ncbi:MAG: helix-turn-helix domain-containing protein [Anaerolineae bacterium]|nr:helix-turn-helix domain-containing protein [Anaerolineae bacterium]